MMSTNAHLPLQAVNPNAQRAAMQLSTRLGEHLVSVIYYPEQFYHGGLVAVFRDDAACLVDLIAQAFTCVPLDLFLHCLRCRELPELCLPAFTWLHVLNRHIQLPYLIKYRGQVLWGEDPRDDISSPPEPAVLFRIHLESCAQFMRNHTVLRLLASSKYLELIKRIDWQLKCLMSTALLVRGELHRPLDSIGTRFEEAYRDQRLGTLLRDFAVLKAFTDHDNEVAARTAAYEAVWIFECFLRRLRVYASSTK